MLLNNYGFVSKSVYFLNNFIAIVEDNLEQRSQCPYERSEGTLKEISGIAQGRDRD